jgi:hypothetical protein
LLVAKAPPATSQSPRGSAGTSGASKLAAPDGNVRLEPAPTPTDPTPATATAPASPASPPAQTTQPSAQPPADNPPAKHHPHTKDAPTTKVTGAVVQVNPAAHGYAIATSQGDLLPVHTAHLPKLGEVVETDVTELANGTRQEVRRTATGSDPSAKLRGTVTFVAADQPSYVVSALGTSLLVHSTVGRPLPALLDLVTVTVRFADPPARLLEDSLSIDGHATGAVDLHGTIQSVDPQARTLVLGADDLRESGRDVSLLVPAELDLGTLELGHVIAATVQVEPDGSYRLTAAKPDDDAKAADRQG